GHQRRRRFGKVWTCQTRHGSVEVLLRPRLQVVVHIAVGQTEGATGVLRRCDLHVARDTAEREANGDLFQKLRPLRFGRARNTVRMNSSESPDIVSVTLATSFPFASSVPSTATRHSLGRDGAAGVFVPSAAPDAGSHNNETSRH